MWILVENLSSESTEDEIAELFDIYGDVDSITVIAEEPGEDSPATALVVMSSAEDASSAIEALDKTVFMDRRLKVRRVTAKTAMKFRGDELSAPMSSHGRAGQPGV